MRTVEEEHFCQDIDNFPTEKYLQIGVGMGKRILIVGESPAENGWRKSGKAFYSPEGKLLASGKRLNELLANFGLDVSTCGFTELAKCFVGKNRKVLGDCCKKCWPILEKQINRGDYRLVITLGVIPAQIIGEILEKEINMGEMAEILIGGKARKLLPIYHPSPVNPFGRTKNKQIFDKYRSEIREILE